MDCPTVRVVSPVSDENPHGYIVINQSDLTDDHEVFDEKLDPAGSPDSANTEPRQKRKYTKQTDK
jgi:hypothetical protein